MGSSIIIYCNINFSHGNGHVSRMLIMLQYMGWARVINIHVLGNHISLERHLESELILKFKLW